MRPIPNKTPGKRKGSQRMHLIAKVAEPEPPGNRLPTNNAIAIMALAALTANQNEFQRAFCPAATAPGSSVQVRETKTNCRIGNPAEINTINMVQQPQTRKRAGPSC